MSQGIPEALVDANLYDCDAAPNSLNNDKNPLSVGSNSVSLGRVGEPPHLFYHSSNTDTDKKQISRA
jgi:hypothetical protein